MVSDSLGRAILFGMIFFTFVPTFVVSFLISFFVVRSRLKRKSQQMQAWHMFSIFFISVLIGAAITVVAIFVQIKLDDTSTRTDSFYPCKWVLCIGNFIQPYSTKESEALIPKLDFGIYQAKAIGVGGSSYKISYFEINENPTLQMIYSKAGYMYQSMGFEITQVKFNEGLVQDKQHHVTTDGTEVWGGGNSEFIYKKGNTAIKVSGMGFELDMATGKDKISDAMLAVINDLQKTSPEDLVLVSRSPEAREKEKNDATRRYRQTQQDNNPAPVYIIK